MPFVATFESQSPLLSGEFLWSKLLDIPETCDILNLDLLCASLRRADCSINQVPYSRRRSRAPNTRSYYAAQIQRPKCLSATDGTFGELMTRIEAFGDSAVNAAQQGRSHMPQPRKHPETGKPEFTCRENRLAMNSPAIHRTPAGSLSQANAMYILIYSRASCKTPERSRFLKNKKTQ